MIETRQNPRFRPVDPQATPCARLQGVSGALQGLPEGHVTRLSAQNHPGGAR